MQLVVNYSRNIRFREIRNLISTHAGCFLKLNPKIFSLNKSQSTVTILQVLELKFKLEVSWYTLYNHNIENKNFRTIGEMRLELGRIVNNKEK